LLVVPVLPVLAHFPFATVTWMPTVTDGAAVQAEPVLACTVPVILKDECTSYVAGTFTSTTRVA
jgi:hypothetical protein